MASFRACWVRRRSRYRRQAVSPDWSCLRWSERDKALHTGLAERHLPERWSTRALATASIVQGDQLKVRSHLHRPPVCCIEEQGSTELRQSGRSLHPVAALAGQPEKALVSGVKTHHKFSVGGKRPSGRPICVRSTDAHLLARWKRSMATAISHSSGWASQAALGVSSAGESSSRPASGLK